MQQIGDLQGALDRLGQAEQQRVRKVDDVEAGLRHEPVEQLADFLALEAALAAQHRHRQLAEIPGIDLDLTARRQPQRPVGVPETIQQARRVPEERGVLLQEDADAAEEDVAAADVALVRPRGRVDGREQHVVAAREQLRRQRVVAQAAPAVHRARAARE